MEKVIDYIGEHILQILSVCVVPLALWLFKDKKPLSQRAMDKIDAHVKECSEMPKSTLIAKIDSLDEKVCDFMTDTRQFRTSVDANFNRLHERLDNQRATSR